MGSLSGLFTRNWTLKLSAFGVALLVWVAVRAEAPARQEVPGVPVRVDLADPSWALDGDPSPASVTVRFAGPSRELIWGVDRPTVVIPLSEVTAPDTTIVLSAAWVRVQDRPGLIVEDIQPPTIRLTLQPQERASLPAAPRTLGAPPDGLAIASRPGVEPAELRVFGPRSRVAELDSIPLVAIDLSEVSASGQFRVAVDTAAIRGVTVEPAFANLDIRIEDRVDRVVSGIPIVFPDALTDSVAGLLESEPSTASVIIRGARSIVEQADPTGLRLVVRIEAADIPGPGETAEFSISLQGLPALLVGDIQASVVTVTNGAVEPEP